MPAREGGSLELVQRYRQLVEDYEALDRQIDALVAAGRGEKRPMSAADLRRYRELARRRSDLLNALRLLERRLNLTGDGPSDANRGE